MVLLLLGAAVVSACGGDSTDATIPALLPDAATAQFSTGPGNPYWPLLAGSRWVYEGKDDGEFEHIEVTVEAEVRRVMGVDAVVIRDVVSGTDGVIEDTFDWYLQDNAGNVWYVGEDSKEIDDGEVVSTAGSWEAGVDGAQPGVIMWADPAAHVGAAYFQEYYPGEAEDKAEVLRRGDTVTVAAGTFDDVLVVREWNPLEPGVTELKYFAQGVGLILEEIESGGESRIELVEYLIGG
jgi:hypothetical protein